MELRKVDPRALKFDPNNPRKIAASEGADAAMIASIKEIGILQPPTVRETNGNLVIKYGERRVRAVLKLKIPEILVLVLNEDDHTGDASDDYDQATDQLRSLSENVVRAPMNPVDLWRAIEKLTTQHWTEASVALALAIPVREVKKLKLLGNVHPAILAQIAAGDMPDAQHLRTIASAASEDQASIWKKFKPKKGHSAVWWEVARALEKRRIYASVAKFGPDEEEAFGIVWEEDLFAQGDEDCRYTTQTDAFFAAQRTWMEANLPKNGVLLSVDDYGNPKLPRDAVKIWTKPKKGDSIGWAINQRDGSIVETNFTQQNGKAGGGQSRGGDAGNDDIPPVAKTRSEITQKGTEIIGALRTAALEKALLQNPFDDVTLIGLLVLAFSATNVSIRTGGFSSDDRNKVIRELTEGGRLTQDLDVLRRGARDMLASFLSSRPGMNDSGVVARLAGDAIGADQHLPNMATEEFLGCLSKPAIEKAAASLSVLPRPRAKETRAALIAQIGQGAFVHPAAHFALTEAEREKFENSLRTCRSSYDDNDETDSDTTEDGCDESASSAVVGDEDGEAAEHSADENTSADLNAYEDGHEEDDPETSSIASVEQEDPFAIDADEPNENAHLYTAPEQPQDVQSASSSTGA